VSTLEQLPIRLAFRTEGGFWNAYALSDDPKEGVCLLGSIAIGIVARNPRCKRRFMDTMQDALGEIVGDAVGGRPIWGEPQRAPDSERGGTA
jgi:hypothetical protein